MCNFLFLPEDLFPIFSNPQNWLNVIVVPMVSAPMLASPSVRLLSLYEYPFVSVIDFAGFLLESWNTAHAV